MKTEMKMFASLKLCIVTTLFAFGCESAQDCPRKEWTRFGDYCYMVSPIPMSWNEAQAYCESWDANLVEIDSVEENFFVESLMEDAYLDRVWIGLKAALYWYDSSVPVFTNWASGEPNGQATEPCGSMDRRYDNAYGVWNDVPCAGVSDIGLVCKSRKLKL